MPRGRGCRHTKARKRRSFLVQNSNLTSAGNKTYQYDYANRLTQFTDACNTIQYTYDGDGNRLGMTVAGAVYENYQYVYDINAGIPRLLVERKDNQDLGQYIWGNRLLGRISPDGQEFYHQDALGSTKMMTDLFGQTVNSYGYDVFGTPNASRDGSLLAWKSDKRYSTPMRKGSGSDARTTAA